MRRFRETVTPAVERECVLTYAPTGNPGAVSAMHQSYTTGESRKSITDLYEPYGDAVWPFKPVHINSYTVYRKPGKAAAKRPCEPDWLYAGHRYFDPSPLSPGVLPEPPGWMFTRLSQRLEAEMPDLAKGLPDLTVFLSELGDMKGIIDLSRKGESMARHVLNSMANVHLTNAFVIAPFIGDMRSILENLTGFKRRLDYIIAGLEKIHDFKSSITHAESSYEETPCSIIGSCGVYGKRVDLRYKVSITVKYRYHFDRSISDVRDSLAVFLSSIGLLPNIETVWEKIPLSFVIDWFVNVQQFLSRIHLGSDSIIDIDILDMCVAIRKQGKSTAWRIGGCYPDPIVYEINEKDYRREIGWNAFASYLPLFKLPTNMQIVTGTALAVGLGLLPEYATS